jgi:hypothetical protein
MATHLIAKIFGWLQFGLQVGNQVFSQPIHGWPGWLASIASLAAAVGIHAASNTAGNS